MSLHHFYHNVWLSARNNQWRIGQALFNELCNEWPRAAEMLRATTSDPFHAESPADKRYEAAIKYIEKAWFVESDSPFFVANK